MNVFKQFKHFICISLCIILIFTFSQFSKPKEVKAIEPVTTLTYATYLLIGGLATMCGVKFASMPKEARYDFISGGFEAIRDIAQWGTDPRGLATKLFLNEATIKAFLEYVQSKEGTSLALEDDFNFTGPSLDLPFKFSQGKGVLKDLCSFTLNKDCYISANAYCPGTDSISSLTLYSSYYDFKKGDVVSFNYAWDLSGRYYYMVNLYKNGNYVAQAYQGYGSSDPGDKYLNLEFLLKFDTSLIEDGTFKSFLNKTVLYPKSLTDVRGIEDYNKLYDKTNVGQQSIEVDGTKTGVDVSTPIEGNESLVKDIVFPAGIEEGIEVPGLKINAGEGSIEASPDTTRDDTLEHQGILQEILDWIGSLFLSLFKFLLDLLEKLIQLLKELLISLFVPSDAFVQEKVDMLKNQLEPKLPYAQYIKLFDSSYEGNELKDIIINIYGQDVVIVKVTLFEHFRDLFNTGVYAVMFFLLAVYNYNNIYKLIRGTDYVSATNTINNATGGTGGSGKGGGD